MNAARDLAATGTPGPWRVRDSRTGTWLDAGDYDEPLAPEVPACMAYCYGGSSRTSLTEVDAAKIVRAVNALGPLGDLLDALRVERQHHAICFTRCLWCKTVRGNAARARDAVEAALRGEGS